MNSSLLLFAAAAVVAVSGSAVYPALHHAPATTQYHSQDELGQYAYGYSGGPSAKHEQRTADGVTQGGYSYVDANGLVQSLSYVSDPVNGFRVAGTNLPVDSNTPVVHHVAPAPVLAAAEPAVVDARHLAVHSYAAPAPAYSYAAAPAHAYSYAAAPAHAYSYAAAAPAPAYPYVAAAPAHPLLKLAQPLTPAGTSNVHYPEHHAVIVAARKKRSAGLYPYPLVSAYAAAPAPAHIVSVKHTEYAAPPAPIVHHVAAPYAVAAPAPVASSYTSVVRHDSAPLVSHYAAAPAPLVSHYAAPAPAPLVSHYAAPAPAPVVLSAPVEVPRVYSAAPVAHVAVAPVKSQFHSQDEHGQYTYGYTDGSSAKSETRYADGETRGSYSYVDDHGAVQAVHYSAGAEGFKAAGTNIPVHHV